MLYFATSKGSDKIVSLSLHRRNIDSALKISYFGKTAERRRRKAVSLRQTDCYDRQAAEGFGAGAPEPFAAFLFRSRLGACPSPGLRDAKHGLGGEPVNEVLRQEKKYLMNHYFEQFKGTLFRQTMFAEFEMITHKMAEDGEVLSAQALCDVYRKLNEEYFGEDMVIDDEIALEWSRICLLYTSPSPRDA